MSGAYGFSAADSVTGAIYQWTLGTIDFSGAGYPGPNSPVNQRLVATSNQGPAGAPGAAGGSIPAVDILADSNIASLNTVQTINGISTSGKRILLAGQTTQSENGPYTCPAGAGAWVLDFTSNGAVAAAIGQGVYVKPGGLTGQDVTLYLQSGATLAAAKVYARQVSGVGVVAVDVVSLTTLTHSGLGAVVDGYTLVDGSVVLDVGAGECLVARSGAWTRPPQFSADSQVVPGLHFRVTGGMLGVGTVWGLATGSTIAGAKTFERLPDAALRALVVPVAYSGDTSGVTDTARINAALAYVKALGGGCVQLPVAKFWVNADLVCDLVQGCELAGSAIGGGGGTYSTQCIRVGASSFETGHRAFIQPAVNATVIVTVDSTTGMVAGKYCQTFALDGGAGLRDGNHYQITATGSGTVTLKNIGSTGNSAAGLTIAADFLWADDSIVQMRSASNSCVRDIQLQAASALYHGKAVQFNGNTFAQDVAHSGVTDVTIIGAAFAQVNPPLLALNASTHPAASLTGTATVCMDLLVEILSSTTYRYSTDGGRTYDENSLAAPLTIATTHVFPASSNAFGLTLNLPAGSYANGMRYSRRLGMKRSIDYQNCFTVWTDNVRFDTVNDGLYHSGQSGAHRVAGLHVGGYAVVLQNCNAVDVDLDPEPGGNGYGRGGIYGAIGADCHYRVKAGDRLNAGPWMILNGDQNPSISGVFSIDPASTGTAGAAISMLGCSNVKIRGTFGCDKVFDVSRAGTQTQGVFVEQVAGFTHNFAYSGTLFSGSNVSAVSYTNVSSQVLSGVTMINAAGSYAGLVCGAGTQATVATCIAVGGQGGVGRTWGSNTGAAIEIAQPSAGIGNGIAYYSCQSGAGGHSFIVHDAATATYLQRVQFRVSETGVCHAGTTVTLANGQNDNIAIKSSYVEITGPTGAFSMTGFVPDADFNDGQILRVVWPIAQAATFKHDTGSTAANRTVTPTAADVTCATPAVGGYGFADLQYSKTSSRFRLLNHT